MASLRKYQSVNWRELLVLSDGRRKEVEMSPIFISNWKVNEL